MNQMKPDISDCLPSPADEIISAFVNKLLTISPSFIEGIYITGSIPLKDFHFDKSDIDFFVLCQKTPDANQISQIRKVHRGIRKSYGKPDLNGIYLNSDDLRSGNPE